MLEQGKPVVPQVPVAPTHDVQPKPQFATVLQDVEAQPLCAWMAFGADRAVMRGSAAIEAKPARRIISRRDTPPK
jgi:hypothetical protein